MKTGSKLNKIADVFTTLQQYAVYTYLFGMLGAFPLVFNDGYNGIGDAKMLLFQTLTKLLLVFYVGILFLKGCLQFFYVIIPILKRQKGLAAEKTVNGFLTALEKLSFLDCAILVYGICVMLSYLFSDYKEFALYGAAGWEMGFLTQLMMIAVYFMISRQKQWFVNLLVFHMLSSCVTFALGILHRFRIDPLHFYDGLDEVSRKMFLSTIGQSSWFSSYVCAGVFLGMAVFYLRKEIFDKKKKVSYYAAVFLSGLYTILGFGVLVVQNSDSAFAALAGALGLLGYFSLQRSDRWLRYLELAGLMLGSFVTMGILQKLFVERAVPLDALSVFCTQSPWIKAALVVVIGLHLFYRKKAGDNRLLEKTKKIYSIGLCLAAAAVVCTVLLIYLNTSGYLLDWFGWQSSHNYLLFNENWGNGRGMNWMISMQAYKELPFYQKLFGVGPDSLEILIQSIPNYNQAMTHYFGNIRVTNAHNEFLNSLICYGIVGVTAWVAVLIGGIRYFYKKTEEHPYYIAFALCIVSYACHNFFCYQQVCCTPFLFIFLGMGESLTKFSNLFISVYRD